MYVEFSNEQQNPLLFLRENTGLNKIARLATNHGASAESMYFQLKMDLEINGFEFL